MCKKWICMKFSSRFKGTLLSKDRGKLSSQEQLQATRRGLLQCLLASWRGLFTPLARPGVIMAKPHVSGDSSLFGHHFRSGMTLNRMYGCRHTFVLQRQCIPFWPCTILGCFSHDSCGRIKHGGTQNSFLLFMPTTHREYLLILIFPLTLTIFKPVTGVKKIKMRANGQEDLRFCSSNLIWKLEFDKVAFVSPPLEFL